MSKDMLFVNGELVEPDKLNISPFDRGHLFGDGVYELAPVYNGKVFALLPHMENLFNSVIKVKIPGIYTVEELVTFHEELLEATGVTEGEVYTQITRGDSGYNLEFPELSVPQLIMSVRPVDRSKLAETRKKGVNLITVPDLRGEMCDVNTIGRMQEILAKQKAKVGRAYDALFVLPDKKITESTEAAFVLVKDGILWTYPEGGHVHKNVTFRLIKEKLAAELDMQVIEKPFTVDFAVKAEEAFLCSPRCEIMPVYKIDRQLVGDGKIGETVPKLQKLFEDCVAKECPKKK
jgi:D-alanine transaminase